MVSSLIDAMFFLHFQFNATGHFIGPHIFFGNGCTLYWTMIRPLWHQDTPTKGINVIPTLGEMTHALGLMPIPPQNK